MKFVVVILCCLLCACSADRAECKDPEVSASISGNSDKVTSVCEFHTSIRTDCTPTVRRPGYPAAKWLASWGEYHCDNLAPGYGTFQSCGGRSLYRFSGDSKYIDVWGTCTYPE